MRCRECDALYLVQAYRLHKFSKLKDILFEDFYVVKDEREADYLNRTYTGIQLEHKLIPAFRFR